MNKYKIERNEIYEKEPNITAGVSRIRIANLGAERADGGIHIEALLPLNSTPKNGQFFHSSDQ